MVLLVTVKVTQFIQMFRYMHQNWCNCRNMFGQ